VLLDEVALLVGTMWRSFSIFKDVRVVEASDYLRRAFFCDPMAS
jgi:hypothetical protein